MRKAILLAALVATGLLAVGCGSGDGGTAEGPPPATGSAHPGSKMEPVASPGGAGGTAAPQGGGGMPGANQATGTDK